MTKEKLDLLLKNEAITQEEYDEWLEKSENRSEESEPEEVESNSAFDDEKLEKLIQAKVDRITSKLGKEKASMQKQLEKLKKEKLSDEELKQYELSQKEQEIAEREKALLEKENRLYAIKAIKSAGLDDGSDKSLELVDFVLSEETDVIDNRVKAFGALVKKFAQSEIDKTFKENGRNPNAGSKAKTTQNPYAKETFNLTKIMELEAKDPELANQLQSAAMQ